MDRYKGQKDQKPLKRDGGGGGGGEERRPCQRVSRIRGYRDGAGKPIDVPLVGGQDALKFEHIVPLSPRLKSREITKNSKNTKSSGSAFLSSTSRNGIPLRLPYNSREISPSSTN